MKSSFLMTLADKKSNLYFSLLCFFWTLAPILAIDMPRFTAYYYSVLSLMFFVSYIFIFKEKIPLSKNSLIFALSIFGLSAASIFWAKFPETSTDKVITLSYLLIPQVLLISLFQKIDVTRLRPYLYFIPIGYTIAYAVICFDFLSDGLLFNSIRGIDMNSPANPAEFNRSSTMMALFVLINVSIINLYKSNFQAVLLGVLPIFIMIYFTNSQSAQFGLLLGLLFYFLFPYAKKWAWLSLKIIIVSLMISAPFFVTPLYDNFANDLQNIEIMNQAYAPHRLEMWDYIARYIMQNPWTGFGIEATRDITDFDPRNVFDFAKTTLHPHNFALQIWIEFGVIGILISAAFMWKALSLIQSQNFNAQRLMLSTTMAAMVPLASAHGIWQGWWLVFLFNLAAWCILIGRLHKEKTE